MVKRLTGKEERKLLRKVREKLEKERKKIEEEKKKKSEKVRKRREDVFKTFFKKALASKKMTKFTLPKFGAEEQKVLMKRRETTAKKILASRFTSPIQKQMARRLLGT